MTALEQVLNAYRAGTISLEEALAQLRGGFFENLEHTTIDHDREARTGAAEVIYAEHKTPDQVEAAFAALLANGSDLLGINPYGQPGVEKYKRNMNRLLRESVIQN